MDRTGPLPEVSDIILGAGPVNLATAAVDGRWVSMANSFGMNVVVISGKGTAGEDPVITLQQAQDATGTGAKVLEMRSAAYKVAALDFTAATDLWVDTPITRESPAVSYVNTDAAENEFIANFYVIGQDLDINNKFTHIRARIADVGAGAQLGAILYIPVGRYHKGLLRQSFLA